MGALCSKSQPGYQKLEAEATIRESRLKTQELSNRLGKAESDTQRAYEALKQYQNAIVQATIENDYQRMIATKTTSFANAKIAELRSLSGEVQWLKAEREKLVESVEQAQKVRDHYRRIAARAKTQVDSTLAEVESLRGEVEKLKTEREELREKAETAEEKVREWKENAELERKEYDMWKLSAEQKKEKKQGKQYVT